MIRKFQNKMFVCQKSVITQNLVYETTFRVLTKKNSLQNFSINYKPFNSKAKANPYPNLKLVLIFLVIIIHYTDLQINLLIPVCIY